MRTIQTLAVILLTAIATLLLAAPASAGSASCSEYGYSTWEYWRFEPQTGGCSYMPGDAFSGRMETLLFIADGGRGDDFEIYVTDSAGREVSVGASCAGADCGTIRDHRPFASVTCAGVCDIKYQFELDGAPVTIDLRADAMFRDFDAVATYGGSTTMVGVTSKATVIDPNQGFWEIEYQLDQPTTNPFVIPQVNVSGGEVIHNYWQTDTLLHVEIKAEPGPVSATLPEGSVVMPEGSKNEGETAFFQVSAPAPMVELNDLVQQGETNTLTARYNARSDVDHNGLLPEVSGPVGQVQDLVDPFGGEVRIPLTGPGLVSLTLPQAFYVDAYDYQSDPQGPVSIEAHYGIALQALDAPDSAQGGSEITLTAQSSIPENQGQVRFLREGQVIGTAPLAGGRASIQATMPTANTTFSAEIIEAGGIVQHGVAIATEVVHQKRPLDISLNVPENLAIGEEVLIGLSVSDPDFAGQLTFSTTDGQISRELPAQSRQVGFTPDRAGNITFKLASSGDDMFEDAAASDVSRTISKRDTSITLEATPEAVHPQDEVTLKINLSEAGIETGRVVVLANGQIIQVLPASGQADMRISHQPAQAGGILYQIHLTGSETHKDAASNPARVMVSQVEGDLSLSISDTSPEVAERVEITAAVPKGHDGTLRILRDGRLVAVYEAGKPGPHYVFEAEEPGETTIIAELVGGARHADLRSEAVKIEISPKTSELSLHASTEKAAPGDEIELTASITPSDAEGTITFTANGAVIDSLPVGANGKTSSSYQIKDENVVVGASFEPATLRHAAAVAPNVRVVVSQLATTLKLHTDQVDIVPGEEFTLTATFSEKPANGALILFSEGQEVSRLPVDGRSSYAFTRKAPAAGEVSFHVALTQSQRFEDVESDKVVISVKRIESALVLDLSSTSAYPGAKIHAIASLDPAPTSGKVSFLLDGEVLASLPAAGRVEFSFSAPDAGRHAIEARFSGNERMQPASSNVETLSVAKLPVELTLSAGREAAVTGDVLALTATLDSVEAEGEILFFNGETKIGSAKIAKGSGIVNWTATRGTAHLHAQYAGDGTHEPAQSKVLVLDVEASTQEVFEEKAPLIQKAVEDETRRAAQARLRHHEWMMRDARTRLRSRGNTVSRSFMPLSYSGMLKADDTRAFAKGAFHGGGDMGSYRRYVYGAFDVSREEGYGTTFEFNGAVAWEKAFGENALGGVYLGAEIGRTNLANGFDGEIDSQGVNLGIYGAKRVAGDVVVDGFANIARLKHDIKLKDESLAAEGSYASTALQIGGAVTGEHHLSAFTLAPQLALVHAANWAEDAEMTAEGASGASAVTLEGTRNHSTRLTVTPELIFPIGMGGATELSLAPRAICQVEKTDGTTRGCGGGLGIGLDRGFAAGLGHFSADLEVEDVSGRRREMLRLDVTLDF